MESGRAVQDNRKCPAPAHRLPRSEGCAQEVWRAKELGALSTDFGQLRPLAVKPKRIVYAGHEGRRFDRGSKLCVISAEERRKPWLFYG